jgi:hypothetical protein
MKTLRSILVCILLASLTGAAIYACLLLHHSDRSAAASNETIAMLNTALKGEHANGDDGLLALAKVLLQNADGAANALKQTLQASDKIAKAQEKKTGELADSSIALVKSGGAVVVKLGASIDTLNAVIGDVKTGTLPKLNAGMDALNGLITDFRPAAKSSADLVNEATGDVKAFHGTLNLANLLLADPNLATTEKNFAAISGNVVVITKEGGGIAVDVHAMTTAAVKPKSILGKIWAAVVVASRFAGAL